MGSSLLPALAIVDCLPNYPWSLDLEERCNTSLFATDIIDGSNSAQRRVL